MASFVQTEHAFGAPTTGLPNGRNFPLNISLEDGEEFTQFTFSVEALPDWVTTAVVLFSSIPGGLPELHMVIEPHAAIDDVRFGIEMYRDGSIVSALGCSLSLHDPASIAPLEARDQAGTPVVLVAPSYSVKLPFTPINFWDGTPLEVESVTISDALPDNHMASIHQSENENGLDEWWLFTNVPGPYAATVAFEVSSPVYNTTAIYEMTIGTSEEADKTTPQMVMDANWNHPRYKNDKVEITVIFNFAVDLTEDDFHLTNCVFASGLFTHSDPAQQTVYSALITPLNPNSISSVRLKNGRIRAHGYPNGPAYTQHLGGKASTSFVAARMQGYVPVEVPEPIEPDPVEPDPVVPDPVVPDPVVPDPVVPKPVEPDPIIPDAGEVDPVVPEIKDPPAQPKPPAPGQYQTSTFADDSGIKSVAYGVANNGATGTKMIHLGGVLDKAMTVIIQPLSGTGQIQLQISVDSTDTINNGFGIWAAYGAPIAASSNSSLATIVDCPATAIRFLCSDNASTYNYRTLKPI